MHIVVFMVLRDSHLHHVPSDIMSVGGYSRPFRKPPVSLQ